MKPALSPALLIVAALAACGSPDPAYGPPELSGLVGVRPYPGPGDVCQVIGENALTANYLDDSATLIGCPRAESGAIAERMAEGAVQVGRAGEWVLLSVPGI